MIAGSLSCLPLVSVDPPGPHDRPARDTRALASSRLSQLARYALIAEGEPIHSAMYPGSCYGQPFADKMEVSIRQHALESACFSVNATAWLEADQQAQIMKDTGCAIGPISGGCFTAIVNPESQIVGEPLTVGEGEVIADLDVAEIDTRKGPMDASGHYSRPELLSLMIDRTSAAHVHERRAQPKAKVEPPAVNEERAG